MIDLASIQGPAKFAIGGPAKDLAGSEGSDSFVQIVQGLAQCLPRADGAPGAELISVASAIGPGALVGGNILAGPPPIASDEAAEGGSTRVPQEVGRAEDEPGAIEAILALLGATASQLQPWQIRLSGKGQPVARDLPREMIGLTGGERTPSPGLHADFWPGLAPSDADLRSQTDNALRLLAEGATEPGAAGVATSARKPGDALSSATAEGFHPAWTADTLVGLAGGTSTDGKKADPARTAHLEVGVRSATWGARGVRLETPDTASLGGLGHGANEAAGSPKGQLLAQGSDRLAEATGDGNSSRAEDSSGQRSEREHETPLPATLGSLESAGAPAGEVQRPDRAEGPETNPLRHAVVDQILRRAQLISQRGLTGLSLQMEPKELGRVQVQVSLGSDGLTVRMAAEANDTRDIIQSSLSYLKTALESQGLAVDRFEVGIGSGFASHSSAHNEDRGQIFGGAKTGQHLPDDDGAARGEPAVLGGQDSLVDYRI